MGRLGFEVLDDLQCVGRGGVRHDASAAFELDRFEDDAFFGRSQDVVAGLGVDDRDAAVCRGLCPTAVGDYLFVEVADKIATRINLLFIFSLSIPSL